MKAVRYSRFGPASEVAELVNTQRSGWRRRFTWPAAGLMPLPPGERTSQLNSVAAALNLEAFRCGRRAAVDLERLSRMMEAPREVPAPHLRSLVAHRRAFLVCRKNGASSWPR